MDGAAEGTAKKRRRTLFGAGLGDAGLSCF
jgi:hypothetical protein